MSTQNQTQPSPLWKADAVASYLDVSVDHVYRLAAAGRIPAIKVGRSWRFDPAALAAGTMPAAPAPRAKLPVVVPAKPAKLEHSQPPVPAAKPAGRKTRGSSLRERLKASDPYADLRASA